MAKLNRKNNKKETTKKETTKKERPVYDYEIKVTRVLDGKYGILFDVELNHVTIYGCRVCETRDENNFVGFPQKPDRKKKGRYWSVAYAPLTDEQTAEVMRQIAEILDTGEDEG